MSKKKIDIVIPQSKMDITLGQWIEFQKVAEIKDVDADFLNRKMLEIFCKVPAEYTRLLKAVDITEINSNLQKLFQFKSQLYRTFSFRGVEYGLINDFDKHITEREIIDLDNYLTQKEYSRYLSILYRPITVKQSGLYQIEPYKETHTLFNDLPFEYYEGVNGFFLTFLKDIPKHILKYIQRNPKMMKGMDTTFLGKLNLLKDGVDILNSFG